MIGMQKNINFFIYYYFMNTNKNEEKFIYFDWVSYINNNVDLLACGMNNKEDAWYHWVHNGKSEKRKFFTILDEYDEENKKDESLQNFDWVSYLDNNVDLIESGIYSKEEAWIHWLNHGKNEGRIFYNIHKVYKNHRNDTNIEESEFDWETYLDNYEDLREAGVSTKEHAWEHWKRHGKDEGRTFYKPIEIPDSFDWENYLKTYGDLRLSGISTKEHAWEHWINYGINEERTCEYKNTTKIHCARFGNLFFLNMVGSLISANNNLKMEYKYENKFKELGIDFCNGNKTYEEDFVLRDDNFLKFIYENNILPVKKNIVFTNEMWCHKKDFCFLLENYFKNQNIRDKIINKNLFKSRYSNNEDLYIHVRLGDTIENYNYLSFDYYDKILSEKSFEKGYISSDTIKHDICKELIKKYKLNIIHESDIRTIMFGSTCKYIVLSGGTYSWLIGFFGFYSEVFYPAKRKGVWYGNIFVFPKWNEIESKNSDEFEQNGYLKYLETNESDEYDDEC